MALKKITTPKGSIINSGNGKAELTWSPDFAAKRNAQFSRKQMFVDSEVLRRCSPRVPFKTGMLEKSGKLGTSIGSGEVNYIAKYAAVQYDCSGLVIRCLEEAGIPAKSSGATYTGNMPEVLPKIGFKDVVKSVDLATGSGMIRGDVLLGNGHTAFYCGNGKLVHASINEKGTVTGGKSGDQTGREICIRSYYNKPWIHVYRYTGVTASASGTVNVRNYLQKGDSGDAVKEMQKMLIGCGFSCGSSGVDGSFGGDTEKALLAFQAFYGLEQDGKYGPVSKSKLVSAYNGKTAASVPEKKNTPSYTAGHEYALQVELKVRTGPGTNYSAKKHSQLTADGQKHDKDNDGCLDAGTVVTCQEVRNVGNDIWMKAPSGWMAAYYDGKVYIK